MLADPLTIDTTYILAADLPAVSRGANTSTYRLLVSSDTYTVTISHTYNKGRRRSMVRLDKSRTVTDPFTSLGVPAVLSTYLVIDRSETYDTDAQVVAHVVELLGVLACATNANVVTTRIASIASGQS